MATLVGLVSKYFYLQQTPHPFGATHTALNFPSVSGAFGVWALMLVAAFIGFAAEQLLVKCNPESTDHDDTKVVESKPHSLHIEGSVDEHDLDDFYIMLQIYMNVKVIRSVDNE